MANRSNRNRKAKLRHDVNRHDAVRRIQELRRCAAASPHANGRERANKKWKKHKGEKYKDV